MPPRVSTSRWQYSDPAWEVAKAYRRPMDPAEGVAECAALSEQYRRLWPSRTVGMVELHEVLEALQAKKIPFVLTGTHGISSWTGRPRATKDVDILVKPGRNYARAVKALAARFPQLEVRPFFGVTGFFPPGGKESVLDVTYPHRADIEETLEAAIWVEERGLRYRVPALETAVANKYGAMLSPLREPGKRGQDLVDFYLMVKHSTDEGREPLDLEWLAQLGEKVWPGGGGAELLRLVEEVKAGRMPRIDPVGGVETP